MSTTPTSNSKTTPQVLRGYVNRVETLEEQKKEISTDIKDVYDEAANEGFDKKALREVIKRRKKSKAELTELESLVDLYESNL